MRLRLAHLGACSDSVRFCKTLESFNRTASSISRFVSFIRLAVRFDVVILMPPLADLTATFCLCAVI